MSAATLKFGSDNATGAQGVLRMVADDLTGALDTAAKFATPKAAIRVTWSTTSLARGVATVFDSGCRELIEREAATAFSRAMPWLEPVPDGLSFLKLDSLLRGNAGDEIAACARRWPDRPIVVAPALPEQSRVTRGGRQYLLRASGAEIVGEDIAASLSAAGLSAKLRSPTDPASPGINLIDAERDDDLDRVAEEYQVHAPLWCGSSGLGIALSRRLGFAGARITRALIAPVLGIFGSNHDVLVEQLDAVRSDVIRLVATEAAVSDVSHRLTHRRVALVTFAHPEGTSRLDARASIEKRAASLLERIPKPGTLVVSGGETLRSVATALGAEALDVDGELDKGAPTSTLVGGRWDGVRVVSKSGAFGRPDFLLRLVAGIKDHLKEQTP